MSPVAQTPATRFQRQSIRLAGSPPRAVMVGAEGLQVCLSMRMRFELPFLIALPLTLGGAACAQPEEGARAILFDQPNFQGTSITIVERSTDLAAQSFAGRAMSGHFDGDWTVCDAPQYRGHCEEVSGDVANLADVGLGGPIASLRQADATAGRTSADAADHP